MLASKCAIYYIDVDDDDLFDMISMATDSHLNGGDCFITCVDVVRDIVADQDNDPKVIAFYKEVLDSIDDDFEDDLWFYI